MCCALPVLSRCCCCVPLRTGLIVWGYLRMILAVSYLLGILHGFGTQFNAKVLAVLLALLSFLVANVVFSIIFVIGLHKNNYKLLRIYYSFSIFALFLTLLAYVILIGVQIVIALSPEEGTSNTGLSTFALNLSTIISLFLDFYFIALIRSEILKLKNQRSYFFNNKPGETSVILEIPREQDKTCDVYTDSESEEEVLKKPLFPVQELERLKKELVDRRM